METGPLGIAFLRPEQLFGITGLDSISNAAFWSMFFNLGLYILGSLYFEQDGNEQGLAEEFVSTIPSATIETQKASSELHVDLEQKRGEVDQIFCHYFPREKASEMTLACLVKLNIEKKDRITLLELTKFHNEAERRLSGAIGAAAAFQAIKKGTTFSQQEEIELSKVYCDFIASLKLRPEDEIRGLNQQLQSAFFQIHKKNIELADTLNELKGTQAQMIQAEKMASIGQLAAGVAHEINNPVGFVSSNLKSLADYQKDLRQIISAYGQLMVQLSNLKDSSLDLPLIEAQSALIQEKASDLDIDFILEDIPNLLEESREGLDRIKKIVLDLKDFSHPGEDVLKMSNLNQNLDSTLNIVWNELKYKASILKEYAANLPQVNCYPQQLNQVFMNILVNAAQAIEKQGEIRIVTRETSGFVEIVISDTGQGIPKDNLSKIYDPFFTSKEVGKGTGLGLNVAYNIIKKHHGTIDVQSEVGKGTTFTIRVPVNGPVSLADTKQENA